MTEFRVLQAGGSVLMLVDGKLVMEAPWEKAEEVWKAIRVAAKAAEAWGKAEAIAQDQAILLRAGVPVGLSGDRRVLSEAVKGAAWDRKLRRAMPGGVRSREVFGLATVRKVGR